MTELRVWNRPFEPIRLFYSIAKYPELARLYMVLNFLNREFYDFWETTSNENTAALFTNSHVDLWVICALFGARYFMHFFSGSSQRDGAVWNEVNEAK